ncbi:aqualysin-1-like [Lytechinus variegatus]|uniref:aqualysin-1-like n=1 Tax=Lytechinus variegatus TaxID=7654 RepID=UPI001BB28928|nr:aqualysin-1-like [Lytechinus variegatus]
MQALLVLLFAAVTQASLAPFYRVEPNIPGQYIVVLEDGVDVGRFAASIKTGTVRKTLTGILNAVVLTLDNNLLDIVRGLNGVRYIEEDGLATVLGSRNPSQYWGLDRIGQRNMPLDGSINFSGTGSGANVFIIDTGIRHNHEDFGARAEFFHDYQEKVGEDCNGHGTHCAGTAGGTYSGVAVGTNLFSVRVMSCLGSGSYSNIIDGVNAVAASSKPNKVASMSIGGGVSTALNEAVEGAISGGKVVVVVAAGNDNADACNYSPASAGNAITVGATRASVDGNSDLRSSFSNYGTCVDIFAPGSSISSASYSSDTSYTSMSGTSMACPHVAGAAAIIRGDASSLTPSLVTARLLNDASSNKITSPGTGSPNLLLYVE